jgi:hypothetical protein
MGIFFLSDGIGEESAAMIGDGEEDGLIFSVVGHPRRFERPAGSK